MTLDKSEGLGLILVDNDVDDQFQTVVLGFQNLANGEVGPAEQCGRILIDDHLFTLHKVTSTSFDTHSFSGTLYSQPPTMV